jgi:hypothetical protein
VRFLPHVVLAVAAAATVLIVVGATQPWAVINGTHLGTAGIDANVGKTTIALALAAFVLLVVSFLRRLRWLALTAAMPAGAAAGLAFYYASDPSSFLGSAGTDIAHRGWGMTVDMVGGIVLTICCLLLALRPR